MKDSLQLPRLIYLPVLVTLLLARTAVSFGSPTPELIVPSTSSAGSGASYINGFELYNNGLYFSDGHGDCSVEFRDYGQVGVLGIIGASAHVIQRDCAFGPIGFTRNEAYMFFSDAQHLYRKAVNSV